MRRPGRQFIETWQHQRYKDKVDIYLDKKDGRFHGEYSDEVLFSSTLEELRKLLSKKVEESTNLNWIPVIMITLNGHSNFHRDKKIGPGATEEVSTDSEDERVEKGSAHFDLHFERFWMAKQEKGTWLACHIWNSEDVGGKSDSYKSDRDHDFHAPLPRRLNSREFYLHREDVKNFKLPFHHADNSFNDKKECHYVKYTPELWSGLNELAFKVDDLIEKLQKLLGSDKGLRLVEGLVKNLLPESVR